MATSHFPDAPWRRLTPKESGLSSVLCLWEKVPQPLKEAMRSEGPVLNPHVAQALIYGIDIQADGLPDLNVYTAVCLDYIKSLEPGLVEGALRQLNSISPTISLLVRLAGDIPTPRDIRFAVRRSKEASYYSLGNILDEISREEDVTGVTVSTALGIWLDTGHSTRDFAECLLETTYAGTAIDIVCSLDSDPNAPIVKEICLHIVDILIDSLTAKKNAAYSMIYSLGYDQNYQKLLNITGLGVTLLNRIIALFPADIVDVDVLNSFFRPYSDLGIAVDPTIAAEFVRKRTDPELLNELADYQFTEQARMLDGLLSLTPDCGPIAQRMLSDLPAPDAMEYAVEYEELFRTAYRHIPIEDLRAIFLAPTRRPPTKKELHVLASIPKAANDPQLRELCLKSSLSTKTLTLLMQSSDKEAQEDILRHTEYISPLVNIVKGNTILKPSVKVPTPIMAKALATGTLRQRSRLLGTLSQRVGRPPTV